MPFRKDTDNMSDRPVDSLAFPNPEPCYELLTNLLEVNKKSKGAVIKLYLENFKSFNDTFGFQFGGQLISEIGRFLLEVPGAQVFRTAGVEFILIMDGASHSAAQAAVEKILDRFDGAWTIQGTDCMCAMNLALSFYPGHASTSSEMMVNLAHAISQSARMGQNQLAIFDEDLRQKVARKSGIAHDIPKALEEGRVEIRYRPSHNVRENCFTRADCYIRMISEEYGIIQSAEFIPIAEESGQINAVTKYALKTVCKMVATLIDTGREFETIAVPISPILFQQEHFVEDVFNVIRDAGVLPEKIAFEITESILLSSYSIAQMRMNDLSDMGIEIVLTEFGTGYSGISNILDMPANAVKLDRMLMWQLDNNERMVPIVEGLIHIATNLGLKTIAEGVETPTQVDYLQRFGCDYEQGFFYSATMTAPELMSALKKK